MEELRVLNFRNLTQQKISFSEGINVFYGDNAQGKTNFLEAIYLLSTSKSFRTRADHELITWGQESSKVVGKASFLEIELLITQNKKSLLVNKQEKRLTDLIGSFLTVLFTPADIEIVSGSPDKRRRFLDQLGCSLSRDYLVNLVKISRVLRSRNQLLWELKQGRNVDLSVWDLQLAKLASLIWRFRFELMLALQESLQKLSKKLTGGELKIIYVTQAKGESDKKIEENFLEELQLLRNEEIQKSQTQIGPQRDDFKILLEVEEGAKVVSKDLNTYGSRGEQRAASLALKLSEIEIIEHEKNTRPTLLLDDVLGELDQNHQKLLLAQLKKGQSFLTTTSIESFGQNLIGKFKKLKVEKGIVTIAD